MSEEKTKKKRHKASKQWIKWMMIVALVTVAYVIYSMLTTKESLVQSSVSSAKADRALSVAGAGGSDRYNDQVVIANDENAEKARSEGRSFIPTLERGGEVDLTQFEMTAPEPAPAPVQVAPVAPPPPAAPPQQQTQQRQQRQQPDANMVAAMQAYSSQWRRGTPAMTVVYTEPAERGDTRGDGTDADNTEEEMRVLPVLGPESPFKVGQILYVENMFAVDSDKRSPVVAKVLSGPQAGGKFIGGFERQDDALILVYNTYADPDGVVTPITAYAVDPNQKTMNVSSEVDYHRFQRWGGLIAASFLEGFSDAFSRGAGSTTIATAGSTIVTEEPYDSREQVLIASGKVGERLADKADANFDRPPTVTLYPEMTMGVMIVGK